MGKIVPNSKIVVHGASYREDVGGTRYSGSEIIVRKLSEKGGDVVVHDPYVKHWWEFEKQETYPSPGLSMSRFFRNQDQLNELDISQDLSRVLKGVDCVILAIRHKAYMELTPDEVVEMTEGKAAIIDCIGILDDRAIKRCFELGWEVKGLGQGHIKRIKDGVRQ